jgi:hypothetical protein
MIEFEESIYQSMLLWPNQTPETNCRPASPLDGWRQSERVVHAQPCVSGGSRSALRWTAMKYTLLLISVLALNASCSHSPGPVSETSIGAQTPLGISREQVSVVWAKQGWVEPGARALSFRYAGTNADFGRLDIRLNDVMLPHTTVLGAWEFDRSNRLVRVDIHTDWSRLPQ